MAELAVDVAGKTEVPVVVAALKEDLNPPKDGTEAVVGGAETGVMVAVLEIVVGAGVAVGAAVDAAAVPKENPK